MKTIYKYPLELTDQQTIGIPGKGSILSAANQAGALCLWAEVDPSQPKQHHDIFIVGTGNPLNVPDRARFIGTVLMPPFVWHVYAD